VTDFSSKGLLPQLTDVLEAFAESHERLLWRVRELRAEYSPAEASGVGDFSSRSGDSHILGNPALSAGTDTPTTRTQAESPPPLDASEASPESPRHASTDIGVDRGVETPAFGVQLTEERTPASVDATAAGRSQQEPAGGQAPATSVEPIPTQHADQVEAESADRDYNFFDELDDRLARLDQDPPSEPSESDDPRTPG
jgi:hypothetical protein